MRNFRASLLGAVLLFEFAVGPALASVGHPFTLSHVRCKNATCSVGQGYQPGLSTVEVAGALPAYAGYSVRLIIARKSGSSVAVVDERTLGIFSDGHFTASIPAYNYIDGTYAFAIVPKQSKDVLAAGVFVKGDAEPNSVVPKHSASTALTGEWLGIAGTYGRLRMYSNGTYLFNELGGHYETSGNFIVFSGPLAVWNRGRATIGNGTIEFYWTTPEGAKQYFVFEKV
jgi:hypothetical protein